MSLSYNKKNNVGELRSPMTPPLIWFLYFNLGFIWFLYFFGTILHSP